MPPGSQLTGFQQAVAQLFFQLSESRGFAVAGGAALIASGLISRPTNDIDLFAVERQTVGIPAAAASFEAAAHAQTWNTRRLVDQREFIRLLVTESTGTENVVVDLGRDSPPEQPPRLTILGPTLGDRDLAARKTLALFGRAEGRDFADVFQLASRFGRDRLIRWAHDQDPGFDLSVFADMLASLERRPDRDLPLESSKIKELRAYFADWVAELRR